MNHFPRVLGIPRTNLRPEAGLCLPLAPDFGGAAEVLFLEDWSGCHSALLFWEKLFKVRSKSHPNMDLYSEVCPQTCPLFQIRSKPPILVSFPLALQQVKGVLIELGIQLVMLKLRTVLLNLLYRVSRAKA